MSGAVNISMRPVLFDLNGMAERIDRPIIYYDESLQVQRDTCKTQSEKARITGYALLHRRMRA